MEDNTTQPQQIQSDPPTKQEEEIICRICHEGPEEGRLISPCKCKGSIKYVHVSCLTRWREATSSNSTFKCDICKYQYALYRPKLARFIQHDATVSIITTLAVSGLTLGSGSAVVVLSGEAWDLRNSTFCGLAVVGFFGLIPRMPILIRELPVLFPKLLIGDWALPAFLALMGFGILNTFLGVYQRVRLASKLLARRLGEKILEVQ